MAPLAFKVAYLFFALVVLPQALAGPGCARRNYGKPDCVEKCKDGWGVAGHFMGRNKWGSVINRSDDTDLDSIIAAACGLNQTATPDPGSTPTDLPYSSSSDPPAPNGYVSTPSVSTPGEPTYPTPPPPESTPTSFSTPPTLPSTTPSLPPSPPPPSPSPSSSSSFSTPTLSPPSPTSTPDNVPSPVSSTSPSPVPPVNSPTPQVTSDSTSSFESDALAGHNNYRALHGASPLTWRDDLANTAKTWASGCVFEHSGGKYGENLAAGTGGYTITDAINAWTSEASDYNPNDPVYSHFTQVVWKSTTQLGCAVVTCPAGSIFVAEAGPSQFIACEYDPPGNVEGEFPENVQV